MDPRRFDTLTRALTEAGTRRGLLGLLTTVPVLGGLFALLDLDDVDAKGRRKRRKKRHKHGKGRRRKHHKKCQPDSKSTTCPGGTCGSVINNCKKTVDCGSCDCDPPCAFCEICQSGPNTPGACVPDPEKSGDPCGDPSCAGGVVTAAPTCNASGICQPGAQTSCAPYTQCDGDACATTCDTDGDCSDGFFCDDDDHCVAQGDPGDPCDEEEQCLSGFCVTGVCCTTACDGACDVCDVSGNGTCTTLEDGTTCGSDAICCSGTCESGVCCAAADCTSASAPDCVDHDCVCAADNNQPCAANETCCAAGCFDLASDPDHCGSCTNACAAGEDCCSAECANTDSSHDHCGSCGNACEANEICVDGVCQMCDVVDGQSLAAAVGTVQDGDTLYICAGTYAGTITISKIITLIGAGEGTDGTVIQGGNPVVDIQAGTLDQPVTLQRLRIQNGFQGIHNTGIFMLTSCTVVNNRGSAQGGGLRNDGIATLTDCLFEGNGGISGGGVWSGSHQLTLIRTRVTGNSTSAGQGFLGSGVFNNGGTVTLQDHTIVCANNPTANQCFGVSADGTSGCPAECPAE